MNEKPVTQKTHTTWNVSLRAGESITDRDGTVITNNGRHSISVAIQKPIKSN